MFLDVGIAEPQRAVSERLLHKVPPPLLPFPTCQHDGREAASSYGTLGISALVSCHLGLLHAPLP